MTSLERPAAFPPATAGAAALEYVARVFGAGFVLGIVRELWVRPRVGVRAAELLELPLMLVVWSWRRAPSIAAGLPRTPRERASPSACRRSCCC